KRMADIHMDVEQIAQRGRVLLAVQAPDERGPGSDAGGASLGPQRGVDPLGELLPLIERRSGRALGGHFAILDTTGERGPFLRVALETRRRPDALHMKAARGGLALMAGLTVLLQERLGILKRIAVKRRTQGC